MRSPATSPAKYPPQPGSAAGLTERGSTVTDHGEPLAFAPRAPSSLPLGRTGPSRSVMPIGDHREHHPDHPDHHHPAHQRAEDGQDREAEDDGNDYEESGSAAAQQVIRMLSEMVFDRRHRALLSCRG